MVLPSMVGNRLSDLVFRKSSAIDTYSSMTYDSTVAPRTGAWIETSSCTIALTSVAGRATHGRVD